MTIETIRDVLARILSINKNLTEDSLKTLLDASGWDTSDIQEGMRIFRDYVANNNDMSKVSTKVIVSEPAKEIQNNSISNIISKENDLAKKEDIDTTGSLVNNFGASGMSAISSIIDLTQDKKAAHVAELNSKVEQFELPKATEPIKIENILIKKEEIITAPHILTLEEEVHDLDEYVHRPSWMLIGFNIFLFLITLGLLIYILIH